MTTHCFMLRHLSHDHSKPAVERTCSMETTKRYFINVKFSIEYDTDTAINAAVDLHGDHSCLNHANNISNENVSEYGIFTLIWIKFGSKGRY